MGRKRAENSRPVVLCDEDILALTGGGPDREAIVTTYFVKTAFTGASVNDTITHTQIIDTSATPSTVTTLWRNQTTGLDLASPPAGTNLTLVGSNALTDGQLRATPIAVSGPVTDTQLRATPIAVSGPVTDTQLRATPIAVAKGQQTVTDCVISSGQSLSANVDLGVYRLVGISIPDVFEGTTLTFQSSFDGTTWMNVFDSLGIEKTIPVGVSRRVMLSPADFYGVRYIRVRAGSSVSPTTVGANRTLKLIAEA